MSKLDKMRNKNANALSELTQIRQNIIDLKQYVKK